MGGARDNYDWMLLTEPLYVDNLTSEQLGWICRDEYDLGVLLCTIIAENKKLRQQVGEIND